MKLYTTFIRKVNEVNVKRKTDKLDSYKMKQPEPTHFQKYKKYMNMLDEEDGSFPRVSELSMRLEQDRMMDESRKRLEIAKERQRQKNLEDEQKKLEEKERILKGTASQGQTSEGDDVVFFNMRDTAGKSFLKGLQGKIQTYEELQDAVDSLPKTSPKRQQTLVVPHMNDEAVKKGIRSNSFDTHGN